jgi:TonB family protein
MKSYLVYSCAAHGFLLAALVVVGTLLSKPRMSYYAIDLMSSLPAGGGSEPGPAVSPVSKPIPPAPKVVIPKAAAPAPRAAEEEMPDQDTIRMLAKLKKKRLTQQRSQASGESAESHATDNNAAVSQSAGHGAGGLGSSGAGIVAEAGTAFPYPWYLKSIADRLDKQWKPPQEFEPDTTCQVTFVIDRNGQISGSQMSKSSGDALFDQLALRAVLYANPLPPLPNGFPDDTLKVHMKFVGRRL